MVVVREKAWVSQSTRPWLWTFSHLYNSSWKFYQIATVQLLSGQPVRYGTAGGKRSSGTKSHLPGHSTPARQAGRRVGPVLQPSASLVVVARVGNSRDENLLLQNFFAIFEIFDNCLKFHSLPHFQMKKLLCHFLCYLYLYFTCILSFLPSCGKVPLIIQIQCFSVLQHIPQTKVTYFLMLLGFTDSGTVPVCLSCYRRVDGTFLCKVNIKYANGRDQIKFRHTHEKIPMHYLFPTTFFIYISKSPIQSLT